MSPSPSEAEGLDHFARLGLPRRFGIDRDALEDGYLERAQRVHPDRFAGAPAGERRAAMEQSAALNEGYRTLRDPVLRAEYLCRLEGIDVDSSDPDKGAPQMGQAFLIEMIERREAVAEAEASGAAALDELRGNIDDELEETFDAAVDALEQPDIDAAARGLVKRRYLQRLLDEIDQAIAETE
ncbi:MAG: Fe-S protein assembly co-chaperone HscB [Myxococcota bacterium]